MEHLTLSLKKYHSDIAPLPMKIVSPFPQKQRVSLHASILSEIMDGNEDQQNDLPNRAFSADACLMRNTPIKIPSGASSSSRSSLSSSPKNPFYREIIGEECNEENIDCDIPTRSANPIIYNEAFFGSSHTVAN
jgi:hypothetical protein